MLDRMPVRKAEILIQPLGEEILLYSAQDRAIHVLNVTAQEIWNLCDGNHSIPAIIQEMKARFVLHDQAIDVAQDVHTTINLFAAKGLLTEDQPITNQQ